MHAVAGQDSFGEDAQKFVAYPSCAWSQGKQSLFLVRDGIQSLDGRESGIQTGGIVCENTGDIVRCMNNFILTNCLLDIQSNGREEKFV